VQCYSIILLTYIQGLIDKHDIHLFRSIAYTDHCLHYLLPEELDRSMNLRHRGHEYTLSHIRTTQLKNTLSIDVYLAWSSNYVLLSVYFTLVINDELTFDIHIICV